MMITPSSPYRALQTTISECRNRAIRTAEIPWVEGGRVLVPRCYVVLPSTQPSILRVCLSLGSPGALKPSTTLSMPNRLTAASKGSSPSGEGPNPSSITPWRVKENLRVRGGRRSTATPLNRQQRSPAFRKSAQVAVLYAVSYKEARLLWFS